MCNIRGMSLKLQFFIQWNFSNLYSRSLISEVVKYTNVKCPVYGGVLMESGVLIERGVLIESGVLI